MQLASDAAVGTEQLVSLQHLHHYFSRVKEKGAGGAEMAVLLPSR